MQEKLEKRVTPWFDVIMIKGGSVEETLMYFLMFNISKSSDVQENLTFEKIDNVSC